MERIRLLIVDDHRLFRQGLASLLRTEPSFEVIGEAASGKEALTLVEAERPDVALVDLTMPELPGLRVITDLLLCRPELGIVVVTASQESADVVAAIRAGARGYVLKSADAEALFDVIREVAAGGAAFCNLTIPKVIDLLRVQNVPSEADTMLTPRELQVVALLVDGADNAQIANRLVISENTVKTHVSHILEKLGVKNRADLVSWAGRAGQRPNRIQPEKAAPKSPSQARP